MKWIKYCKLYSLLYSRCKHGLFRVLPLGGLGRTNWNSYLLFYIVSNGRQVLQKCVISSRSAIGGIRANNESLSLRSFFKLKT